MLKFTKEGMIYNNKMYKVSKEDIEWIKKENKKNPQAHPTRNLKSLATTYYEIN